MTISMDDASGFVNPAGAREEPWDAKIKWFGFPDDGEYHAYRLVARPTYYAQNWIQTKKKDGGPGKSFPNLNRNYDSARAAWAENGDKISEYLRRFDGVMRQLKIPYENYPDSIKRMSGRLTMACNAVIRDIQSAGAPANNTGKWTYVHPIRIPQGLAATLVGLAEKLNKIDGKVYPLTDRNYGRDLLISFDSQSKDKNKIYQVQVGDRTKLTDDELAQQEFLIDFASHLKYPEPTALEETLRRNGFYELLDEYEARLSLTSIPKAGPTPKPEAPARAAASSPFDDGGPVNADLGEALGESQALQ
jgi:hypothetical protein